MSLFIDTLADQIRQSIDDADATREDWTTAIAQVFGSDHAAPSETEPHQFDPLEPSDESLLVAWQIDSDESVSPAQAALQAWQRNFRRGNDRPTADDACVFDVSQGDRRVQVDLSDPQFAHLFKR